MVLNSLMDAFGVIFTLIIRQRGGVYEWLYRFRKRFSCDRFIANK